MLRKVVVDDIGCLFARYRDRRRFAGSNRVMDGDHRGRTMNRAYSAAFSARRATSECPNIELSGASFQLFVAPSIFSAS
jgi:hypothetical protein